MTDQKTVFRNQVSSQNTENRQIVYSLRGGGCTTGKMANNAIQPIYTRQYDVTSKAMILSDLQELANVILKKSEKFKETRYRETVIRSIQQFHSKGESIQDQINSKQHIKILYKALRELLEKLLTSALRFLKTNGLLSLFLLQLCSQYSKFIAQLFLNDTKEKGFKKPEKFFELIKKLQNVSDIESNQIWKNGIDSEIAIIKQALKFMANDNPESIQSRKMKFLGGLYQFSKDFSSETDQLKAIINYDNFSLLQLPYTGSNYFEAFYFIDWIKWQVIRQIGQGELAQAIQIQLQYAYKKNLENNIKWSNHYFWIKMLSELVQYKPMVKKSTFTSILEELEVKDEDGLWEKMISQSQIIIFNQQNDKKSEQGLFDIYSNGQQLINENIDNMIYESLYKGINQLKILQKYLIKATTEGESIRLISSYITYGAEDQPQNNANENQQNQNKNQSDHILYQLVPEKQYTVLHGKLQKSLQNVIDISDKLEYSMQFITQDEKTITEDEVLLYISNVKNDYQSLNQQLDLFYQQQQTIMQMINFQVLQYSHLKQLITPDEQQVEGEQQQPTDLINLIKASFQIEFLNFRNQYLLKEIQRFRSKQVDNKNDEANLFIFNQYDIITQKVDQLKTQVFSNEELTKTFNQLTQQVTIPKLKNQTQNIKTDIVSVADKILILKQGFEELVHNEIMKQPAEAKQNLIFEIVKLFHDQYLELSKEYSGFLDQYYSVQELCLQSIYKLDSQEVTKENKIIEQMSIQQFKNQLQQMQQLKWKKGFQKFSVELKSQYNFFFAVIETNFITLKQFQNDKDFENIILKLFDKVTSKFLPLSSLNLNACQQIQLQKLQTFFQNQLQFKFTHSLEDLEVQLQQLKLQKDNLSNYITNFQKNQEQNQGFVDRQLKRRKFVKQEQKAYVDAILKFKETIVKDINGLLGEQQPEQSVGKGLNQETSGIASTNVETKETQEQIQVNKDGQSFGGGSNQLNLQSIIGDLEKILSHQQQFNLEAQSYNLSEIASQIQDFDEQYIPLIRNYYEALQSLKSHKVQHLDYVKLLSQTFRAEILKLNLQSLGDEKRVKNNVIQRLINHGIRTTDRIQQEITQINDYILKLQEEIRVAKKFSFAYEEKEYKKQVFEFLKDNILKMVESNKLSENYEEAKTYTLGKFENYLATLHKSVIKKKQIEQQQIDQSFVEFYQTCQQSMNNLINNISQSYQEKLKQIDGNEDGPLVIHEEWMVREALICVILSILMNQRCKYARKFGQETLINLWKYEKDSRVKYLLENKELLGLETQLISNNWKQRHDELKAEFLQQQQKLSILQKKVVQQKGDSDQRKSYQIQLKKQYQIVSDQLDNLQDMTTKMQFVVQFIKEIKKELAHVEIQVNQIRDEGAEFYFLGSDVKNLKRKTYEQLLEVRMKSVLKEKEKKALSTIYIDLKIEEINIEKNLPYSNRHFPLFSLGKQNDGSQLAQFLEKEYDILLIHGQAGSGKSTASKKIEEILWEQYKQNMKMQKDYQTTQNFIPIFVSLPSLQDPRFNVLEEALGSNQYKLNKQQIEELREAVQNNLVKLVIILDSYDQMKIEYIKQNFYQTNQLGKQWNNPKVIYSTRTELLGENYRNWFKSKELKPEKFKEIRILMFSYQQQRKYLKKYCLLSVKVILLEIYSVLQDAKQFMSTWKQIEQSIKIDERKSGFLLDQFQVQYILSFCSKDNVLSQMNDDQVLNIKVLMESLWSIQMYRQTIDNIGLKNILKTPYMMEIVVKVLPLMAKKFSDKSYLKFIFTKNFTKLKQQHTRQQSLNHKHIKDIAQTPLNQDSKQELSEVPNLYKQAIDMWDYLNKNNFINNYSIAYHLTSINTEKKNKIKMNDKDYDINNEDPELIIQSLQQNSNFCKYDFYEEYVKLHHDTQVEKWRLLFNTNEQEFRDQDQVVQAMRQQQTGGEPDRWKDLSKQYNPDVVSADLMKYACNLALQMTENEKTQVDYKNVGMLKFNSQKQEDKWEDYFFNDQEQNGEYKKLIRSGILMNQKDHVFSFTHKSIQEFLVAKVIYDQFAALVSDFNFKLLEYIIKRNRQIQKQLDVSQLDKEKADEVINDYLNTAEMTANYLKISKKKRYLLDLEKIIELLQEIAKGTFNNVNLSSENYWGTATFLTEKFNHQPKMKQLLLNLVKITSIYKDLIRAGSNSIFLLVQMNELLGKEDFSQIELQDTNINGATLAFSNLSESKFTNIKISGINLTGCILFNANWCKLNINELPSFLGHTNGVKSVAYSVDGNIIASGSSDNTVRLWDMKSGRQLSVFEGHTSSVNCVAFSPKDNILATGSQDKTIRLWDMDKKKELGIFTGQEKDHEKVINTVAFSPDGNILASGGRDNQITFWEVKTRKKSFTLPGHSSGVNTLSFSSDNNNLASGGRDNVIIIWDVKAKKQVSSLSGHISAVNCVVYSPGGSTLASGSMDNTIRLWDIKSGTELKIIQNHDSAVLTVSFSPDGATLASGSWDNTIRLWNVQNALEVGSLQGHKGEVFSVAFSPDKSTLVSGSGDNSIRIWDLKNRKTLQNQQSSSSEYFSVSYAENTIISGSRDNTMTLWDLKSGKEINTIECHYSSELYPMCLSPDSRYIATSSEGDDIIIFDANNGDTKSNSYLQSQVNTICYHPEGKFIATGQQNNCISILSIASELKVVYKFSDHSGPILSVNYSYNGNLLVSGSADNTIKLWDTLNGEDVATFQGHTREVNSVCFCPKAELIASGSSDNTIRLWNVRSTKDNQQQQNLQQQKKQQFETNELEQPLKGVKTQAEVAVLIGHMGGIFSVTFSPDGTVLVSGSEDKTIRVWDPQSKKELQILNGHAGTVNSVSFSAEGNILISGSKDNTIRLWDIGISNEMPTLKSEAQTINILSFSPDRFTLGIGKVDNTIRIFDIKSRKDIAIVKDNIYNIEQISFSPDGYYGAATSSDNTIDIWEVKSGKIVYEYSSYDIQQLFVDSNSNKKIKVKDIYFSIDNKILKILFDNDQVNYFSIQINNEEGMQLRLFEDQKYEYIANTTLSYIQQRQPICYKIISRKLQQLSAQDALLIQGQFESETDFKLRKLLLQRGAIDIEPQLDNDQ